MKSFLKNATPSMELLAAAAIAFGLAAAPANAQPTGKAANVANVFRISASNASQGTLTLQSAAAGQIQIKASGKAGTGDRARIPANVTAAVNASVIERARAQAVCNDVAYFLNNPPTLPDGFPFSFPDFGPEWVCTAKPHATDRATGKTTYVCNCEPTFPGM